MEIRIERIEDAGPDRRARRLVFATPDESRTTSAAVARVLGLEAGGCFDDDELESSLLEAESACAWERALRVLGYRERSTRELTKRLTDDGYPLEIVGDVVARAQALLLVDDERFAASWTRARLSARYGPMRIRRELKEKGIGDEMIDAVLGEVSHEELLGNARVTIYGLPLYTRQQRDRAVAKLLRKGYERHTALQAISASLERE